MADSQETIPVPSNRVWPSHLYAYEDSRTTKASMRILSSLAFFASMLDGLGADVGSRHDMKFSDARV